MVCGLEHGGPIRVEATVTREAATGVLESKGKGVGRAVHCGVAHLREKGVWRSRTVAPSCETSGGWVGGDGGARFGGLEARGRAGGR